jgi:hypothetical protein
VVVIGECKFQRSLVVIIVACFTLSSSLLFSISLGRSCGMGQAGHCRSGLIRRARGVREVGRTRRALNLLRRFANIAMRLPVGFLAVAVAVEGCFAAGATAFSRATGTCRTS